MENYTYGGQILHATSSIVARSSTKASDDLTQLMLRIGGVFKQPYPKLKTFACKEHIESVKNAYDWKKKCKKEFQKFKNFEEYTYDVIPSGTRSTRPICSKTKEVRSKNYKDKVYYNEPTFERALRLAVENMVFDIVDIRRKFVKWSKPENMNLLVVKFIKSIDPEKSYTRSEIGDIALNVTGSNSSASKMISHCMRNSVGRSGGYGKILNKTREGIYHVHSELVEDFKTYFN